MARKVRDTIRVIDLIHNIAEGHLDEVILPDVLPREVSRDVGRLNANGKVIQKNMILVDPQTAESRKVMWIKRNGPETPEDN